MNPVLCKSSCRRLQSPGMKQVEEHGVALPSKIANGFDIRCHIAVSGAKVRSMRSDRLLEWHRRDKHQAPCASGKLIQQPVVCRYKLRQTPCSIERLDLPKLRDDHGGASRFEL